MKIISNKTARKAVGLLIALAKRVRVSSFEGLTEEQIGQFNKFTKDVTDIVYALGGISGLVFLDSECGISSNYKLSEEEK